MPLASSARSSHFSSAFISFSLLSFAWKNPMPGFTPCVGSDFSCHIFHGKISIVCSPSAKRSACTHTIGPLAMPKLSAIAHARALHICCGVLHRFGMLRPQNAPGISS